MNMSFYPNHTPGVSCFCQSCGHLRVKASSQGNIWAHCVILLRPKWTSRWKVLYHGTTVANAQSILDHGVQLPQIRTRRSSPGQFSYHGAFYLTDRPEAAAEYAQKNSGQSQVVVLAFQWDVAGMKIRNFHDESSIGFLEYFIFSMTNFGSDVTTIFKRGVFQQTGFADRWHPQCPDLHQLRTLAAGMVSQYDMITGPMLGVLSRNVWQYAITSQRGLSRLSRPFPQLYGSQPGLRYPFY
ncbi:hypothetical protein C8R43DRAFT_1000540 [Mycena crocata]|nr:hypothetical protein C8R43DRAFT_1000540 [Mycena crocata]